MSFAVVPVGTVVGGRRDPANTDNWGAVTSTIVIDERFGDDALRIGVTMCEVIAR